MTLYTEPTLYLYNCKLKGHAQVKGQICMTLYIKLYWTNLKKIVCFPLRNPTHEGMGRQLNNCIFLQFPNMYLTSDVPVPPSRAGNDQVKWEIHQTLILNGTLYLSPHLVTFLPNTALPFSHLYCEIYSQTLYHKILSELGPIGLLLGYTNLFSVSDHISLI